MKFPANGAYIRRGFGGARCLAVAFLFDDDPETAALQAWYEVGAAIDRYADPDQLLADE